MDHRNKLAPIAEAPYKVTKVDDKTFVIKTTEWSVQNVSRLRVVLAPKSQMEKVSKLLQPVN